MTDETRELLREQLENDHPETIVCSECDEEIKAGQAYYDLGDRKICEDCMSYLKCYA